MSIKSNQPPASFKKINSIVFSFLLLYVLILVARLLEIKNITDYIPDMATRMIIENENPWIICIKLLIILSSLLGTYFLLKRKDNAYKYFLISFVGISFIMYHEFFIDVDHHFNESIMMIFIFLFYSLMLLYALNARNRGWLSSLTNKGTVTLKVQQGCDNECPYCPVSSNQGKSDSDSLENIIANARQIAANGVKQIVLSGSNVVGVGKGEYNDKEHDYTFLELIEELDKVGDVDRFRFASLSSPKIINKKVLETIANSRRFLPHFSIRLQSGSTKTLELMKRRHTLTSFTDLFRNIQKIMPDAYITVEVIAGFPGETDAMFQESYHYLEALDISEIYAWAYFDRPNTEAPKMPGAVPKEIRKKRRMMLKELSNKKLTAFYKSQLGSRQTVLFEKENVKGYIYGFTKNHVKVKTLWDVELVNTLQKVTLTKIDDDGIVLFDFYEEYESEVLREPVQL